MAQSKIPVTASQELVERLEALVQEVQRLVTEQAGRAVNRSTICRVAIEDHVALYEKNPTDLARRLGLSPQISGGA